MQTLPFWQHVSYFCVLPLKNIFYMELVETKKDWLKESHHAKHEFKDTMTKAAALCIWMTKSIWGTKQVCLLDLGFGYMLMLPKLEKRESTEQQSWDRRELAGQRGLMQKIFCGICRGRRKGVKLFAEDQTQTTSILDLGLQAWLTQSTHLKRQILGQQHYQSRNVSIELVADWQRSIILSICTGIMLLTTIIIIAARGPFYLKKLSLLTGWNCGTLDGFLDLWR